MTEIEKTSLARQYPKLYRQTIVLQTSFALLGIAWHNDVFGECCGDFGCCEHSIGDYHTRYPSKNLSND